MKRFPRILYRILLTLGMLTGGIAMPAPALADTEIVVTTLNGGVANDDGFCSLLEALTNANANAATYDDCAAGTGTDSITFDSGAASGTITLSTALPTVTDANGLAIYGGGDIIIDGASTFEIFNINAGGLTTLEQLVLQNASDGCCSGGALHVASGSTVTVRQSLFFGNYATGNGGAIYNDGGLTVERSTFTSNNAGVGGGAIYVGNGNAAVTDSTFYNNEAETTRGGGVLSQSAVTILSSTFSGNSSNIGGAAVHILGGTVTLYNNILANSTTGLDCVLDSGTLSGGYNLIESDDCGFSDGVNGMILGEDPRLGSLVSVPAYFLLRADSPAIDAGTVAHQYGSTDEPGNVRTGDTPWAPDTGYDNGTGTVIDMGAYEYQINCYVPETVYVDQNAAGDQSGTSWDDAFTDLQMALYTASNCSNPEQIWVAAGVYKPDAGDPGNPQTTFTMSPDTLVYGGFDGTETSLSEQDWLANSTILSGDIDDNDTNVDGNNIAEDEDSIQGSNSYHVVFFDGTTTPITGSSGLDGFVITAGNANSSGINSEGGGIFCLAPGAGDQCSPQLAQLLISGNQAAYGGGMYTEAGISTSTSSPQLTNVTLRGNHATGNGGGVFNHSGGVGNASYTGVTFLDNAADVHGGAMVNAGSGGAASPSLQNVTFHSNTALGKGGAMWNVGYSGVNGISSPILKNVTFTSNTADQGGAIVNETLDAGSVSSPNLHNVILWGDSATTSDDEMLNAAAASSTVNPNLDHVVVEGGCPAGSSCADLSTADPMLGSLQDNGGVTETVALGAGSSAIDTGDAGNCITPDQRGVSRPRGAGCDIGAYERIPPFTDFDGDYISDLAKFIPSTGYLWWRTVASATFYATHLGNDVAEYVSRSDFDGDVQTDPAKYVSAGQGLYYFRSSDSSWQSLYMGSGSYTILPGSDFDADNLTDPARYLSTGSIWRLPSSTGIWVGTFIGTDAAPAMPGSDYDGDGKTDLAKYVPSAGAIWYFGSADSTWYGRYIGSDGTPVPASDFDGDGITDMAKYLTSGNSLWYLRSSDNTWVGAYLGPGTFTYVPAVDFDGDGKTDPAKFDTINKGLWWLKSSTDQWDSRYMGGEVYNIVN